MEHSENLDIIIIDDDRDICRLIKEYFKRFDPLRKVISFSSPTEALQHCCEHTSLNVIFIVDFHLSAEMNGFEFLEVLAEKFPSAHENTIICTAACSSDLWHECVRLGIGALLRKPFNPSELQRAVRAVSAKSPFSKSIENLDKKPDDCKLSAASSEDDRKGYGTENGEKISLPGAKKLLAFMDKMRRMSDLADRLSSDGADHEVNEKMSPVKNAMDYCDLLTGIFANLFLDPAPCLTKFDPYKTIAAVFRTLSSDARYHFQQQAVGEGRICSDETLLRQVVFVIFKHIEHYLYGEEGWVEVEVSPSGNLLESGIWERCDLLFRYRWNDARIPSKNKNRVLIVDDDPKICHILKSNFLKYGFEAHSVSSGFDCTDFLSENMVDLIVLDIGMDGMDGNELLENIRYNIKLKSVPVLIYSGRIMLMDPIDILQKYSKFHPVSTLAKPASIENIIMESRDLIKSTPSDYGVKDLFSDTIEDSIRTDSILAMGSYSLHLLSKLLDLKITFQETDILKTIQLRIPSYPSKPLQANESLSRRESLANIGNDLLAALFSDFRHDLKNKLCLISGDVEITKFMVSASPQKELMDQIITGINLYVSALENLHRRP